MHARIAVYRVHGGAGTEVGQSEEDVPLIPRVQCEIGRPVQIGTVIDILLLQDLANKWFACPWIDELPGQVNDFLPHLFVLLAWVHQTFRLPAFHVEIDGAQVASKRIGLRARPIHVQEGKEHQLHQVIHRVETLVFGVLGQPDSVGDTMDVAQCEPSLEQSILESSPGIAPQPQQPHVEEPVIEHNEVMGWSHPVVGKHDDQRIVINSVDNLADLFVHFLEVSHHRSALVSTVSGFSPRMPGVKIVPQLMQNAVRVEDDDHEEVGGVCVHQVRDSPGSKVQQLIARLPEIITAGLGKGLCRIDGVVPNLVLQLLR